MNAPASELEDRLSAALFARAESVHAEDLTPAVPPATVTTLRRRTRPAPYVVAAAAAVAVVATVAITVTGDGSAEPGPAVSPTVSDTSAPSPSETPTQTPTREPVDTELEALLDEDVSPFVEAGQTARYPDGSRASIEGNELVVTMRGTTRRAPLVDTYGATGLSTVQPQLGQAGAGYLVDLGDGENSPFALYVPTSAGGLTVATVTGAVPFGTGFTVDAGAGYYTYTTGDGSGLYTRLELGSPDEQRYTVYRWEVPGPGEGGRTPDNPKIELVPSTVGVFCLDFANRIYERC